MYYRVQRDCMSLHVWSLEQCLTHSKRSVNLSSSYFQGSRWHGPKLCSSVLVTPHELWSGQATRSLGNWGDPRTQWGKGLRVWGLLTVVLISFKCSRICIIILLQVNGRLQSMGSLESDTTERLHFHFSLSCIGEGNGNPLQCSCLENPRDRGAYWAAIYGVAQSRTRLELLSSSSSNTVEHHFFPTWNLFSKHPLCLLINILVQISIMAFKGLNRHLCHIDFWLESSSH